MGRLPVLLFFMLFIYLWMSFLFWSWQYETFLYEVSLMFVGSSKITLMFIGDSISMSFSLVVMTISASVFWFAMEYMSGDEFKFRFGMILFMFVLSMNILIYSGSVFLLLVGWDGLGISSFALIIYYQSNTSLKAGYLTLLTNRIGDVLIICSIPFMIMSGNLYFFSVDHSFLITLLIVLAALTKSAQYPFSAWLPAAMAAPTPVSALVHSSTLVTAGVYLVIRLSLNLILEESVCQLLLFSGAITCILGGFSAIFENDIKKIIAFSTLSQLGLMMFCLGLGIPLLALLHLFTHAMFKALLFLSAGLILMSSFGTQDLRQLGSLLFRSPLLVVIFNISSLCLVGAPFVSAFYSKHAIYEQMMMMGLNSFSMFLMMVGVILTSWYVTRVLKALSWGKVSGLSVQSYLKLTSYFPLLLLFLGSIISGKMFSLLDISMTQSLFVASWFQLLLNFLLVFGVSMGLIWSSPKNSMFFSSMFFLWESSNKSSVFLKGILKQSKVLDYGWLEPKIYFEVSLFKSSFIIQKMFLGVSSYLSSLIPGFSVGILIVSSCIYFW
uniref:NADH-ubiquinone oxidoreductase chain 5 n=1 Tax=Vertigo pusilla TaxID=1282417 RepID=A0A0A6ZAH7_9EUPU|nr:NADH dehydrogenase subunit 5 [Vertigo pusilla]AGC52878.1 NADH dehydrogenase subunit 5 [Vertigo pusilla]